MRWVVKKNSLFEIPLCMAMIAVVIDAIFYSDRNLLVSFISGYICGILGSVFYDLVINKWIMQLTELKNKNKI